MEHVRTVRRMSKRVFAIAKRQCRIIVVVVREYHGIPRLTFPQEKMIYGLQKLSKKKTYAKKRDDSRTPVRISISDFTYKTMSPDGERTRYLLTCDIKVRLSKFVGTCTSDGGPLRKSVQGDLQRLVYMNSSDVERHDNHARKSC